MSNLNKKNSNPKLNRVTQNYKGTTVAKKGTEFQLYEVVVSTLYGKDGYYESSDKRLARLVTAVDDVVKAGNLDFIANTIIHARTVMNIRSMPILLAVHFAKALRDNKKSYDHMRQVICDVIQRADQITDLYAVALGVFGDKKKIPMSIKRGVADAFNKFNEYAFGKYNSSSAVKLKDVLRIVHPKAKSIEQGVLFEKIMNETVETPYTWETQLSANGQLDARERKSKKDLWTELLKSGDIGYMALLRNLRNIGEAGVDSSVMKEYVYSRLADPAEVAKSKQLPFRFVSAIKNTEQLGDTKLKSAISKALDASMVNVPAIGNNVWIIIDCSGSMGSFYGYGWSTSTSNRGSTPPPIETACIFAAALAKANADADNVKITMFSDNAKHIPVNTDDTVISITENLMKKVYGGGTNLQAALDLKKTLKFEPDTVIVLSDMEVDRLRSGYKSATDIFTPETIKIALNLNSNESTPIGEKQGWYQLAGWSERLFDFIPAMRNKTSVVQTLSVPYLGMKVKHINN